MIDSILKAINLASYEQEPNNELSVKFEYLLVLKKEIEDLKVKNNRLNIKLKIEENANKKLNDKLAECYSKDIVNIDKYM